MTVLVVCKGRRENRDHVVTRVIRGIGVTPAHLVHLVQWDFLDLPVQKAIGLASISQNQPRLAMGVIFSSMIFNVL